MKFTFLFLSLNAFALEVVRPGFESKLELKLIRVAPDEFGTYALTNYNYMEMTLTCAFNIAYDRNPKAFIEYRNYYNEIAGRFVIEDDRVCQDMARFIEAAGSGVSSERPFTMILNKKTRTVEKIVYPKIDEFADEAPEEKAPKKVTPPKVLPTAKVQHH